MLAAAALLCIGQSGWAAEDPAARTVTVMAAVQIQGNNVEAARNQAVSAGLDMAVSQVAVDEIPPEIMLSNYQPINLLIHNRADKYIQDYKVLTESRSDRQYSVLLQATVSLDSLEQQLMAAGVLFGRKALPRILFLMAEKSRSDMPPRYWWGQRIAIEEGIAETEAAKALKQKSFSIVEPAESAGAAENAADLTKFNKPDLSDREAIELGRQYKADVVVVGRSMVHLLPNTMGPVQSYQGIVTVRAVRLDTGEKIASSMQTALVVDVDEAAATRQALAKAGALAGADLASQILKVWYRQAHQPTLVEVIVQGSGHLQNFEKFRQTLMQLPGTRDFQIKEMQPDQTRLAVNFEGNAQQLASALMLNAYSGFGIDISEISADRLKIKLISK